MADKIDQLKIGTTSYDIDLPKDASIDIAAAVVGGTAVVTQADLVALTSTGSATVPIYINSSGAFAAVTGIDVSNVKAGSISAASNGASLGSSTSAFRVYATTVGASTVASTTITGTYLTATYGSIYSLTVSTTAAAAAFLATSDRRLKTDIQSPSITSYTALVDAVKVREYKWKQDEERKPNIGVIAQELRDILPEEYRHEFIGGKETENSYLAVNDGKLVYLVIGALQEQAKEITELKKQVEELQEKLG